MGPSGMDVGKDQIVSLLSTFRPREGVPEANRSAIQCGTLSQMHVSNAADLKDKQTALVSESE